MGGDCVYVLVRRALCLGDCCKSLCLGFVPMTCAYVIVRGHCA